MEIERARLLAERLHADDYDEDGTALLEHIRRVVCRVDADVQVVAWLRAWRVGPAGARGEDRRPAGPLPGRLRIANSGCEEAIW
jgi:hypothetical protein